MNNFTCDSDLFEEYEEDNEPSKQEDVSKGCRKNIQTLQLNTNKAGMGGLDTAKINDIIQKASQGSKFFLHKQKCQERIDSRVSEMKKVIAKLTEDQIRKAEEEMTKLGAEMELARDLSQTIVHVDMDMFYAAVEMRDDPSLRDKPMAVGSNSMLSTSNYAARKFGVRAAMPGFIGKKLCPDLVIVPCNFSKYREVSSQIRAVFQEYDPLFCPMSLDEAYLNITEYLEANGDKYSQSNGKTPAEAVVEEMRKKIEQKTQLTASAGIACNTRLAKVCSDMNKPNGQFFLPPDKDAVLKFVKELPIRKVSGIGNVTEQHLKGLGITLCSDLWERRGVLRVLFSSSSYSFFMGVSLGLGSTDVTPSSDREQKSISTETTFGGTSDRKTLFGLCRDLCKELKGDMDRKNLYGKVFTLKVKTADFQIRTRAQTLLEHTQDESVLTAVGQKLLANELDQSQSPLVVRLLGVRMSNLLDKSQISSKRQTTLVDMFRKVSSGGGKQVLGDPVSDDLAASRSAPSSSRHLDLTSDSSEKIENTSSLDPSSGKDLGIDCSSVPKSGETLDISEPDIQTIDIATEPDWPLCNSIEEDQLQIDETETSTLDVKCGSPSNVCDHSNKEMYSCPVCSKATFCDISELNRHIDVCLNLQYVKEMGTGNTLGQSSKDLGGSSRSVCDTGQVKRKVKGGPTPPPSKKIRKSSSQSTLLNYFSFK